MRDSASRRAFAEEVISLSLAQGFPLWLRLGRAVHVAALVADGDAAALSGVADGIAFAGLCG